jgi:hypothetical protein
MSVITSRFVGLNVLEINVLEMRVKVRLSISTTSRAEEGKGGRRDPLRDEMMT